MNANDLVHFMKKRKYEEKSKKLITNQLEIISFEKLNKTVDIYDLLKPKYENMIKEDLVESFKAIAWLKMYKEDLDKWFYSEKVIYIFKRTLLYKVTQCFDPPKCEKTQKDYWSDQGFIYDLKSIPDQLEKKQCNVEENLDSERNVPFYNEIFLKVIEAKNGFNHRKLKILNENSLPYVATVLDQARVSKIKVFNCKR